MKELIKEKKSLLHLFFVIAIFLVLSFAFFFIGKSVVISNVEYSSDVSNFPTRKRYTVVIDAGHGGVDGGASVNDIYEKDINLTLSKRIKELFELYNVDVIMTRETDDLLCDDSSKHKKRDDLFNRLKISETVSNPIFVSIHMNKFPQEKYKGLQVFYSPNNAESEALSLIIQNTTKELIQPENSRQAKKASSAIYILDRITCPAVLVECGFLSNYEDLNNLTSDKYQSKLAFVLVNSIIKFINI